MSFFDGKNSGFVQIQFLLIVSVIVKSKNTGSKLCFVPRRFLCCNQFVCKYDISENISLVPRLQSY